VTSPIESNKKKKKTYFGGGRVIITHEVGKLVEIRVITWITGWRPLNGRLGLRMGVWS